MSGTASRFGPLLSDNGVTFRLWAPAARAVNLVLDRKKIAMPKGGAWFAFNVRQARAGARYHFEIDGDIEIPDPASHFQPDDVRGRAKSSIIAMNGGAPTGRAGHGTRGCSASRGSGAADVAGR